MIRVRLKPEQGIKVSLSPSQNPDVDLKTVYLYDDDWIPEINKAIVEAKESANNASESERNAEANATMAESFSNSALENANRAETSADLAKTSETNAKTSETNAKSSETIAQQYAEETNRDAQFAAQTLDRVLLAEETAVNSAQEVANNVAVVQEKAGEARLSAVQAKEAETSSAEHEAQAKVYRNEAESFSNASKQNAQDALESETSAKASSDSAEQHSKDAGGYAQSASNFLSSTLAAEQSARKASETSIQKAKEASESAEEARAIKESIGVVYSFKGSVATYNQLPDGASVGDVYDVKDTGKNYAWTGTEWDDIGGKFDVTEIEGMIEQKTTVIWRVL